MRLLSHVFKPRAQRPLVPSRCGAGRGGRQAAGLVAALKRETGAWETLGRGRGDLSPAVAF